MRIDRGHPDVTRDACPRRHLGVLHVQLDQRLGMLRDEGDRHQHEGPAFAAGPLPLVFGLRLEPDLRPRAALIAYTPVDVAESGPVSGSPGSNGLSQRGCHPFPIARKTVDSGKRVSTGVTIWGR